jgi:hypothetical protein
MPVKYINSIHLFSSCFSAKQANLNFENLLEELPVVFRNSHLVNSLLCEIDEQTRLSSKSNSFLDLGTR